MCELLSERIKNQEYLVFSISKVMVTIFLRASILTLATCGGVSLISHFYVRMIFFTVNTSEENGNIKHENKS